MAFSQTRKDDGSQRRKRTIGRLNEYEYTSDTSTKQDEFAKRFSLESASSTSTNSSVSIIIIEEINEDEEKKYENNRDSHTKIQKKESLKPNNKSAKLNSNVYERNPRRSRRSKSADGSLQNEHNRQKDSERSQLFSRVHSENDRNTGRKLFCCDGYGERLQLKQDEATCCPLGTIIKQADESTNIKSPRRTGKKCSFAAEASHKSKPATKKVVTSNTSPKKCIQTVCEAQYRSLSSTNFDVDKPGSPMRVCKRTDASTAQTEQAGLTEEQKAWAGIDHLLASEGASIETRDVLPSAVLRALNSDHYSFRQKPKIYRIEVPSERQEMSAKQFACSTSSPTKAENSSKKRTNRASRVHQSTSTKEHKKRIHSSTVERTAKNHCRNRSDANSKQQCRNALSSGTQHIRVDHAGAGRSPRKQGPKKPFQNISSIADELSQLPNEYQVRPTDIFNNSMPSLMTEGSQEMFGIQVMYNISPKWASCSDISYYEAGGNENAEIFGVKTESLGENDGNDLESTGLETFDEYAFYYGEMENRANPNQSTFRDFRLASSPNTKMNVSMAFTKKSQSECKSQATRAKQKAPKRAQRLGSLAVPSKDNHRRHESKKVVTEKKVNVELPQPISAVCSSPLSLEKSPKQMQIKPPLLPLQGISPRKMFKSDLGYVSRFIYCPKSHQRFRNKERTFRLFSTHLPVISLFGRKMNSDGSPKIFDTGRCEAQFYPDHSDQDDDGLGELLER
jgi:hypothetical protein